MRKSRASLIMIRKKLFCGYIVNSWLMPGAKKWKRPTIMNPLW